MKQIRLNCIKSTGEIKEYDPHNFASFVQMTLRLLKLEYDGVFNSRAIIKLPGKHCPNSRTECKC